MAARESSLLSPSGSKAGKAHRVPISSQEAFFLSGRVFGSGRALPAPKEGKKGAFYRPMQRTGKELRRKVIRARASRRSLPGIDEMCA